MSTATAKQPITVTAAQLLSTQSKKFSIDLPAGVHQRLKMIAAAHGTTVKELILDGLINHVFPKYQEGDKHE